MKNIFIISFFCLIALFTGCSSTKNIDPKVQQDFNKEAIYFIENDGKQLILYINNDTTLCERDRQPYKCRLKSLNQLIIKMK